MLDIKRVYIDARFKTLESKSDADFFVELPRSLNVPENCICYIDDIVIPVSWPTIDYDLNTKLYMYVRHPGDNLYKRIEIPGRNYSGPTFAEAL